MTFGAFANPAAAQVNSWTSLTSGNWEDASWSLGTPPGTNQSILITNAGWKAVQISPNTSQNFPQTLNVNSIDIASPTNSSNELLLNYAGYATPLAVQSLSVESNAFMIMDSSALQLDGPNGVGMQVGGEFDQNDSIVSGRQINVGYIGPGVYNMNSGFLAVSNLWVGGQYGGVFNQNGGTNAAGITDVQGGNYVLSNGYFGATIYFDSGGTFTQLGALLQSDLTIFDGTYLLDGGVHEGSVSVPASDGFSSGTGGMTQVGGTNIGSLDIGSYGYGEYTLSNGVSVAGGVLVDGDGNYNQAGGTQNVTGTITVAEEETSYNNYAAGSVYLNGGKISCSGMSLQGYYTQNGGTNMIAGDFTMGGTAESAFSIYGGLMTASNITVDPSWVGSFYMGGGTLVVTNELWIGGISLPEWYGFRGGGQLIVSNIWLAPGAIFDCRSGGISQSGTLTLANATVYGGTGPVQFGQLNLSSGGNTNSILSMPDGSGTLHFANSSGVLWSNGPVLVVQNWSGSLYGGGQQQIVFGSSAMGLTAQQLAQVQFQNPAGLPSGTYPARILPTGEIVPNAGGPLPAQLSLQVQANGMQLTVQGQSGHNYSVQVSTDLVHWATWTNQTNSSGAFTVTDTAAANYPVRFYRAVQLP